MTVKTYTIKQLNRERWTQVPGITLHPATYWPPTKEANEWCRTNCKQDEYIQFEFDWWFKSAKIATAFILKFRRNG